jgi:hypothetical protein
MQMVYRRGELSKGAIDHGWPHQVGVLSSVCAVQANAMQEFCKDLSLCVRGHCYRRDDQDWQVRCFAEREHAERFARRFGGEYLTPETRPPWIERTLRSKR